jgi:hypothetical protein
MTEPRQLPGKFYCAPGDARQNFPRLDNGLKMGGRDGAVSSLEAV